MDDGELEEELDQLQQEQLDEAILKTGNVPVLDAVHIMPSPATAQRESGSCPPHAMDADGQTRAAESSRRAAEEDDEEAELRKLQAEMAM